MLTVPFITLMSQRLYTEYLCWLQRQGWDEEPAGNVMAYAFLHAVEAGEYEVPCDVKTDAHRLYVENRYCLPKTVTSPVGEPVGSRS